MKLRDNSWSNILAAVIILSGNGVVIWEVSVVIQLNTVKPALNSNPLTADRFDKPTSESR